MKFTLRSIAAVAAGICGLAAMSSIAQTVTTYTPGDLFIGFRAVGTNGEMGTGLNYLVKIGQAAQFKNAAAGSSFTLSLGNIGADLAAIYGPNWHQRTDLMWSISGGNTSSSTIVAGDPGRTGYYSVFAGGPGWQTHSFSGQQHNADFQAQAQRYIQTQIGADVMSTANSPVGIIQDQSISNSYGSFQVKGSQTAAYGSFSGGGENSFAPGGVGGTGNGLDLYRLPTISSGAAPGTLVGTFTIDSTGLVTFTAVPEPSTWVLLGLAAAGLVLWTKRARFRSQARN